MANKIRLKRSSNTGVIPVAGPSINEIVAGELALNTADEKLYFINSTGQVVYFISENKSTGGGGGAPADLGTSSNDDLIIPLPTRTGIIVPFYQDPVNVYNNPAVNNLIALIRKYQSVPVIVIINPSSGPGSVANANYTALIKRVQGAGATVIGYVASTVGTKPIASVRAEIDTWRSFYPRIDSIFVDEMSNTAGNESYYTAIKDYCHSLKLYPVVSNPGAGLPESYFSQNTSDIYMIYENSTYPTEPTIAGDYGGGYADYPYSQRAAIVHSSSFSNADLILLRKYFGMVYLTEQPMPNPYLAVSSYIEAVFSSLSNEPNAPTSWIKTTINVPYTSIDYYSSTIAVAGVTEASIVACQLVGGNANAETEAEDMCGMSILASVSNGSITFNLFTKGRFGGPFEVIYMVQ